MHRTAATYFGKGWCQPFASGFFRILITPLFNPTVRVEVKGGVRVTVKVRVKVTVD